MNRIAYRLLHSLLIASCMAPVAVGADDPSCAFDPGAELVRVVKTHGGLARWQALESISVDRVHEFAGRDQFLRFRIDGDYPRHRLYLHWDEPPGQVTWDGERAWSMDWALAPVFLPRYVTTIGFTLVNLPWLALREGRDVSSLGCLDGLPGRESERFRVVSVQYEPEPSRKPDGFEGPRNRYDLYIGEDDGRLVAVMQHWTHAGQLDVWGLTADVQELKQLVVFDSWSEAGGLLWPARYRAYSARGELAATGAFGPYRIDPGFDAARLLPPPGALPDTSSTYLRGVAFTKPGSDDRQGDPSVVDQ